MNSRPRRCSPAPRQRGVSILLAIVLLLLFASLAGLMSTLVSSGNATSAQDALGAQAYQAAQGGVDWGLYQLDPNGSNAALSDCFGNTTLSQFTNYTVTVSCTRYPTPSSASSYAEAGRTVRIMQITATATAVNGWPVGIERQVTATVEKCRDPTITSAPYDCQ